MINSYRAQYSEETANTTEKDVYDAMHLLHTAKEAARVCDAYGEHVEVLIRNHEDMTGSLGST